MLHCLLHAQKLTKLQHCSGDHCHASETEQQKPVLLNSIKADRLTPLVTDPVLRDKRISLEMRAP